MEREKNKRGNVLLRVEDFSLGIKRDARWIPITESINFEIRTGEIFGLVGESGCGKTITCLGILRLLTLDTIKVLSGRIFFKDKDLLKLSVAEIQAIRGAEIAMIFQEPSAALNPLLPLGAQLSFPFKYHPFAGDPEKRILDLLNRVGFSEPNRILRAYPHELSGGMLQRVLIAHALLLKPGLLLADEPTTALDVTVQAQVMELLVKLQHEEDLSVVLITHNLALVGQYADRVAVMYAGKIVEEAPVDVFLAHPLHPYARGLLNSLPKLNSQNPLQPIPGTVPSPQHYTQACRFRDRCSEALDLCAQGPAYTEAVPGHHVACHLPSCLPTPLGKGI